MERAAQVAEPPAGLETRTIVIGDAVDAAPMAARAGLLEYQAAWKQLLDRVTKLARSRSGRHIKSVGDGFFLEFDRATSALDFAAALRESLASNPVGPQDRPIDVRMAIHTGIVQRVRRIYGGDFVGPEIAFAVRVSDQARPGETVLSRETYEQVLHEGRNGLDFEIRRTPLKGFTGTFDLYVLTAAARK
jgi:class 3 adenylate cyclase